MFFRMKNPGEGGRFGNQVIAYCYGQALAQRYNTYLEIPEDSCLRKVFKIDNPVISNQASINTNFDACFEDRYLDILRKFPINLIGYFQKQEAIIYDSSWIKRNLQFQDWIVELFPKHIGPYYACHMRRGDYVNQPQRYCTISDNSFYKKINELDIKMGYILTEENPIVNKYCESVGLGWLPDFMCMVNSEILIRSNSTFSLVAGWFHSGSKIYAPLVEDKIGLCDVDFIEGNWPRCADSKYHPVTLTDMYLND